MFYKNIFFYLLLFTIQIAEAQSFLYKNYTTSEGLSSSEVYDIIQDKNGYMWFATDRGLTRYDGYEFKSYTLEDGLEDFVVLKFYEQKDGTILCSSYNKKLFFIDPHTNSFFPYKHNNLLRSIAGSNFFSNLFIDEDNALMVSFNGFGGYVKIDDKGELVNKSFFCSGQKLYITFQNNEPFIVDHLDKSDTAFLNKISDKISNSCSAFTQKLDNDRFLLVVDKDFYLVNSKDETYKYIRNEKQVVISGKYDENHFWIGLRHGGGKLYAYSGKLLHHFFPEDHITKIFKDHEGGMWIGTTQSGVYYIKNLDIKTYNLSDTNKEVLTLTKNNKDELYLGYASGKLYKRKNNTFENIWESFRNTPVRVQYNKKINRLLVQAENLYEEKSDQIVALNVFGYGRFLSDNQDKNLLTKNSIVSPDSITYFIPPTKDLGIIVRDIEYAEEGYYIGAISGLYQYKQDSLYDLGSKNSLFQTRINDLDQVEDRYYLASLGKGVLIKDKDSVHTISTSNGLSSNLTTEVYVENEREIYVATNNGVNKISYDDTLENYSISSLTTLDGLPGNQINDIEIIKDTVWLASKKGLHSFPKNLFESKNKVIYDDWLQIKDIQVNSNSIQDLEDLEALAYNQNTVEIKYTAISFKKSTDIFFRYRLVGLESAWNTTQNRSVKYTDLDAGEYVFEIQTKGGNNSWNLESIYTTINIQDPFWETWWFYSLLIITIVLIVYSFFKFKILLYNKDVFRELMLYMLKKLTGKKQYVIIKESGVEIKLKTSNIYYAKSAGNYLEIFTTDKVYIVRMKIGDFENLLPDAIDFLRVHRSYIIRKDKIEKKNSKWVQINGETIPVSRNNKDKIDDVIFY